MIAEMGLTHAALLPIFLVFGYTHAQAAQCNTLAGGCDKGRAGQAALQNAVSAFEDGLVYGGGDAIVFSSSVANGVLAQISYLCEDGSVPPQLTGEGIRTL